MNALRTRLPALDGVRGMAIILVVAYYAAFGSIGLLARFNWRRALRLFPAFAASIAAVVLHFDFVTVREQSFSHLADWWTAQSRPSSGAVAV